MSLFLTNFLDDNELFGRSVAQDLQQWRRENSQQSQLSSWRPTSDLKEDKNNYTLSVELPGVKKEDVNITLEKNILTVSGARHSEQKEEGEKFHRVERFFGNFSRSVRVPEGVTEEDIKASMDNGVLHVTFPSKKALPPPPEKKQIAIA